LAAAARASPSVKLTGGIAEFCRDENLGKRLGRLPYE
jgi:hypothetical protein